MRIKTLQKLCHKIAVEKGFWDRLANAIDAQFGDRNDGEIIALMHSELSEALEELRKEDYDMSKVGEELGDCVIRILDYCEARKINLEDIILKKIEKNKKRPRKHGKRF